MLDYITTGYPSIDTIIQLESIPKFGLTSIICSSNNNQYYGGCSVNIAYVGASLGLHTAISTIVGDDFYQGMDSFLTEKNINLNGIEIKKNKKTSYTYLIETKTGEHMTLFSPSAMENNVKFSLNEELIKTAKMGVITVGEKNYIKAFADICIKDNIPIVLGMKCDTNVFSKEFLIDLLENSSIIFMNKSESLAIQEITGYEIEHLFQKKAQCIIITKGTQGSDLYFQENTIQKIAIPIVPAEVEDLTGVGDAYIAGFLYGISKKKTYKESAQCGAVAASFVAEGTGCLSSVAQESNFLERYQKNFK